MTSLQKTLLTLLFFVLLYLAAQAVTMLNANLHYYKAFQLKELWLKNKTLSEKSQYLTAISAINNANSKHPNNPHYLVTQGLILEWGGISSIFSPSEQKSNLVEAKKYYLKALELRPTWPVTWATLAILKWRLNEIDQELINYLHQADKYGSNIIEVHQAWVDIGFYLYQNKSPYTAQIMSGLRRHLQLMLQDKQPWVRRSAISIIKRHHKEALVCKWLLTYSFDTSEQQRAICP
ncbi:VpsP family polysaccharide biosynthesis protein [Colwellia sp. D2M02]|uniref:VpsP family polysaccharide biosynthesis protein n=1 Tax=Colwellia sp. D2M02 TaxID=2841562 RepID=UPI001C0A6499|nr:VpsP family polysaccharide biosynthesis protein [Colwellia sp. D2M02]MBU2892255.1 VpsP family polysaccharide biosynthesis protein [Colwellia sp. D2M02]